MNHTHKAQRPKQRSRGIALVTALLLLSLLTVMTLSMVIATTSDTLIDGYYRNFRGSFYAADSGVNIAREYMLQQIMSSIPTTYTLASGSPIASTVPDVINNATGVLTSRGTLMTNVIATYGSYQSIVGSQTASWPGSFEIDTTTTGGIANTELVAGTAAAAYNDACQPIFTGTGTTPPTCTTLGTPAASYNITGYKYTYSYKITSIGQSRASETHTIEEDGSFIVAVDKGTRAGTTQSFAAYGMFIDQSPICDNSYLVNGTLTGPVFTNGAWNINNGSYIFTDAVGSVSPNIGFTDGSGCDQNAGSTTGTPPTHAYTASDGTHFAPTFQGSVTLGAPAITLPTDSFNQKEAVLDSLGNGLIPSTPSTLQAKMGAILKDASGNPYPATGSTPSSGVFLPYYLNGSTPTFGTTPNILPASTSYITGGVTTTVTDPYGAAAGCGGGIYVEGVATVAITASSAGDGLAQIYTIKQGGTTSTVTVDPGGVISGTTYPAQTTLVTGGTTKVVSGVPQQCDPVSGATTRDATMLYVNGDITDLHGGGSGIGTIQNGNALTITSAGNLTLTGDLLYKTEPVTLTTADSLVPGADHGQVLGIFTASGNIQLNNLQSSGNLEIDATIAALANGGSGGLVNTGSGIGTLNIVGGRIQNTIQNINATTRNVYFDRRFSQNGFAPPWFPSTKIVANGIVNDVIVPSPPNRLSWTDKTAM
jgi:Tfp pilus assembly protein PilX